MSNSQQKIIKKGQKPAKIAHFSNTNFHPKLLTRQQFSHVFSQNNRLGAKIGGFFGLGIISLLGISTILAASVSAETKAQTGVSVEVVNGCSVSVSNSEHNAEISAGTYTESIGDPTVFQIACNDTNKYTINAVGYSNDTEGTTELIGTSDNGNIKTGVQQSGSTSNWNFHLLDNSAGVTISPTFDQPHEIPGSGTVIAKRDSGFKNPGDTGFDIFKVAYSAYISTLQPAGAYRGKVKYTLYNQGIAYSYKITYNLNSGDSGPQPQTGEVMDLTIKLSAEEPKRDGYDFVTWCSTNPGTAETCSGQSYAPGAEYTLPGNNANITLYATWKSAIPDIEDFKCSSISSVGGTAEVMNGDQKITIAKMKDGKCWSKSDVSTSANWSTANTLCKTPWRLPSQSDFSNLILAYYPKATYNSQYTGYKYSFNSDAATFTNDWGATSGSWWSSTTNPSSTNAGGAYFLYLNSSYISSINHYFKTTNYRVRCVSEV